MLLKVTKPCRVLLWTVTVAVFSFYWDVIAILWTSQVFWWSHCWFCKLSNYLSCNSSLCGWAEWASGWRCSALWGSRQVWWQVKLCDPREYNNKSLYKCILLNFNGMKQNSIQTDVQEYRGLCSKFVTYKHMQTVWEEYIQHVLIAAVSFRSFMKTFCRVWCCVVVVSRQTSGGAWSESH